MRPTCIIRRHRFRYATMGKVLVSIFEKDALAKGARRFILTYGAVHSEPQKLDKHTLAGLSREYVLRFYIL